MSKAPSSPASGGGSAADLAAAPTDAALPFELRVGTGAPVRLTLRPVQPGCCRVDGHQLQFDLPDDQHVYFSSDGADDFKSPPPVDALKLAPNTWYTLCGDVVAMGAPTTLWLIEYSDVERLTHVRHVLNPGPLEIRWRTHVDQCRVRMALKIAGAGSISLENLELHSQAESQRLSPAERQRIRAELDRLPPAEIITLGPLSQLQPTLDAGPAAAAEATRDRFFIDAEPTALVAPVDWHQDQRPNTGWPQRLNSWFFIEPVLRARAADEYRPALERVLPLVRHWLDAQPLIDTTLPAYVWSAPMCSARLVYLTLLLRELHRCALLADDDLDLLVTAGATHANWLNDERNYRSDHTQGLLMDLALTLAARHAPFMPGADDWPRLARTRFATTLDTLVDRDSGLCRAHSPDSQLHIASIIAFAAEQGVFPTEEAEQLCRRIRAALAWFVDPAGRIVPIGDTAAIKAPPDVQKQAGQTRGLHIFDRGGIAVVRTDDSHLVFTAGYHNLCHKHADELSFCLHDRGRPLVVDAGNFGYVAGHPARKYCVSGRSHNGLLIDGPAVPLRQQEPYGSAIRASGTSADWYALLGDNPLLASQQAEHQRLLLYRPGVALLLIDRVTATDDGRTCTRLLHLAPNIGLMQVVPGRYQLNLPDGTSLPLLDWTPTGPARGTILFGLRAPHVQGFTFPDRGVWEACHTLALTQPPEGTLALLLPLSADALNDIGDIRHVAAEQVKQQWHFDLITQHQHLRVSQQGDQLALQISAAS